MKTPKKDLFVKMFIDMTGKRPEDYLDDGEKGVKRFQRALRVHGLSAEFRAAVDEAQGGEEKPIINLLDVVSTPTAPAEDGKEAANDGDESPKEGEAKVEAKADPTAEPIK